MADYSNPLRRQAKPLNMRGGLLASLFLTFQALALFHAQPADASTTAFDAATATLATYTSLGLDQNFAANLNAYSLVMSDGVCTATDQHINGASAPLTAPAVRLTGLAFAGAPAGRGRFIVSYTSIRVV